MPLGQAPYPPQMRPGIPQPNGWAGRMGAALGNHPNMLVMAGLGLLDKRQNNALPLSQVGAQAMQGGEMDQERQTRNMTIDWLVKNKGLTPEDAQAAVANPVVLAEYMKSDTGKFGLQPFYMQDEQGNLKAYQLNNSGGAEPIEVDGMSPAPPMHFGDLGTSIAGMNPRTGQVETSTPKDVAGAAAAGAMGGIAGTTAASLPQVESTAQTVLSMIDSIENDPNLAAGTGLSAWTTAIPGTPMFGFGQKVKQLTGQTFLQAYQVLKGAGAITEQEGRAATEAMARLNTAQREEDFRAALNDLKTIITNGVLVARQRASLPGQNNSQAAPEDPLGIR